MPNRAIQQAKRLLQIRSGPASLVLPAEYTSLSLQFSQKNANGHMGPRKFTQQSLPQLQFQNPSLKIDVKRVVDKEDPKNLKIPAVLRLTRRGEEDTEINLQGLHSDEILKRLIKATGATTIQETEGSAVIA